MAKVTYYTYQTYIATSKFAVECLAFKISFVFCRLFQTVSPSAAGFDIDTTTCNTTKACFTSQCSGGAGQPCDYVLTWAAADNNSLSFEMSTSVDSSTRTRWIAFALSQDRSMVRTTNTLDFTCSEKLRVGRSANENRQEIFQCLIILEYII